MFFCKMGKETGNEIIDALTRAFQPFEKALSPIWKAQFCFFGEDLELSVLSQLKLNDIGRRDREDFFQAINKFIDSYWDEVAIDGGIYINLLMRSKGADGGHEFYIITTRGDRRDQQDFRTFVDDFFNFKTKGIDEIMLSKNLDVVFEDRS